VRTPEILKVLLLAQFLHEVIIYLVHFWGIIDVRVGMAALAPGHLESSQSLIM